MAIRLKYPKFKVFTSAGALAAGYKLWTYAAGTSNLLTTYQDSAGTTPHTNPIILDSLGEKEVYVDAAVKLTLMDTEDAVQDGWPVDNIDPTTTTAEEVSFVPSGSVVGVSVQTAMTEIISDLGTRLDVTWSVKSANFTAVSGNGYLVNTLTGTAAITVTMPAAASAGDKIYICDSRGTFNTYNCVLSRNGLKIMGLAENCTLDVNKMAIGMVYDSAGYGWRFV